MVGDTDVALYKLQNVHIIIELSGFTTLAYDILKTNWYIIQM
jgi:hypothetical protein